MPMARTIQVIQEIKDSVERPYSCGWFPHLPQSNQAKRYRAGRYIDGAVKIMDLLRNELYQEDIAEYQRRYDQACEWPADWVDERLYAAKELWKYVLALDEWVSHRRVVTSTGTRGPAASSRPQADDSARARKVQFVGSPRRAAEEDGRLYPARREPPENPTGTTDASWRWPAPGQWHVPSLVPTVQYGWNWAYVPVNSACEIVQNPS